MAGGGGGASYVRSEAGFETLFTIGRQRSTWSGFRAGSCQARVRYPTFTQPAAPLLPRVHPHALRRAREQRRGLTSGASVAAGCDVLRSAARRSLPRNGLLAEVATADGGYDLPEAEHGAQPAGRGEAARLVRRSAGRADLH